VVCHELLRDRGVDKQTALHLAAALALTALGARGPQIEIGGGRTGEPGTTQKDYEMGPLVRYGGPEGREG